MGNADSKRGSADSSNSIMGCQPNRTRDLSDAPDRYFASNGNLKKAATAAKKHRKTKQQYRSCADISTENGGNNHSNSNYGTDAYIDTGSANGSVHRGSQRPPMVAGGAAAAAAQNPHNHRSLSPQFSDSGGSGSTPQRETSDSAYLSAAATSSSFRGRSNVNNVDNASLASNESNRRKANRASVIRRATSFRNTTNFSKGASGSFRRPVCALTGLTDRQKQLITVTWREMDAYTARAMVRNIFEALYKHDARLLRFVGVTGAEEVEEEQASIANAGGDRRRRCRVPRNWRTHPRFRLHVQRFCDTLNEVIRTLHSPALSVDRLLELGADYRITFSNNNTSANVNASVNNTNVYGSGGAIRESACSTSQSTAILCVTNGKTNCRNGANANCDNANSNANCVSAKTNCDGGVDFRGEQSAVAANGAIVGRRSFANDSTNINGNRHKQKNDNGSDSTKSGKTSSHSSSHSSGGDHHQRSAHDDAIPPQYWEALVAAFTYAIRHAHLAEYGGQCAQARTDGYGGGSSESPSPSFLSPGEPPARFRLSQTPSPTFDDVSPCSAHCPPSSFLQPSTNACCVHSRPNCCGSACANATAADNNGGAQITRNSYGSQSFNAPGNCVNSRRNQLFQVGHAHFMAAPSYGNHGVASPLLMPNGASSPNFYADISSIGAGATKSAPSAAAACLLSAMVTASNSPFLSATNFGANRRSYQLKGQAASPVAEAWSLLAVYVVGQIRFGYDMERTLQERAAQLASAIHDADQSGPDADSDSEDCAQCQPESQCQNADIVETSATTIKTGLNSEKSPEANNCQGAEHVDGQYKIDRGPEEKSKIEEIFESKDKDRVEELFEEAKECEAVMEENDHHMDEISKKVEEICQLNERKTTAEEEKSQSHDKKAMDEHGRREAKECEAVDNNGRTDEKVDQIVPLKDNDHTVDHGHKEANGCEVAGEENVAKECETMDDNLQTDQESNAEQIVLLNGKCEMEQEGSHEQNTKVEGVKCETARNEEVTQDLCQEAQKCEASSENKNELAEAKFEERLAEATTPDVEKCKEAADESDENCSCSSHIPTANEKDGGSAEELVDSEPIIMVVDRQACEPVG